MPQFTQWNVPSPFPNVLFNPAAVDASIAETQSKLGELGINRERLGLDQQKLDATRAGNAVWADGNTTGTTGATSGGDGSFLGTLAHIESGDQNIVSQTDKDNKGLTLAQGGNPAEISQGHFQIQTATWKDFAPQAGVDVNKYPNAMSAPREVQAQVAAAIPFARFGPRTQQMMRQRFGDIDASKTVGQLAGGGPRVTPAPYAAPVAVAAATPPATAAQPGQIDPANMAAVKQASTALLAMSEPDAAVAYGPTVRALQARGFAMNAPPTYPGHAALQALVGGGAAATPVAPSPIVARNPGSVDTAGPGAGPDTTLPPIPAPHQLYQTGLPGVTISGPPSSPLAPPSASAPVTTAQAAPGQARPSVSQPPPAPSRALQLEPTIQGGSFDGLTQNQAKAVKAMALSLAPTAEIAARVEVFRQQNIANKQNVATANATQAQQDYDRQRQYRQDQIEAEKTTFDRSEKAKADAIAAENLRLSQEGGTRDTARLEIERKKFDQGSDQAERDDYTLRTVDPSSQQYADAWARKKWTTAPNGNVIENDVSRYPAPTSSVQRPSFLPAPTPQSLDKVREADTDAKVITSGIDHYIDVSSAVGANSWDAFINNPRSPQAQQLLGAFDRMKTVLRSPVYFNTGVLQPAEMAMMKEDLVSPQTLRGLFATPQALATRLGEIKLAILTRQDAELRSIGKPGVIVRDKADLAGVPVGGRYYDEDGHLRVKQEPK